MIVNLDLMYGLPDMNLADWEKTLRSAVASNPDSIATYFLFVDPGTVTHTQLKRGQIALPSHQEIQTQHIMGQLFLEEKGYYELPGDFFAKLYGDLETFTQDTLPSDSVSLPLGAGSYGHYDKTQFFNQFSLKKYREKVQANESPNWRGHRFEGTEGIHRDVMFSFKNSPHIDRSLFIDQYGIDPVDHFPQQFKFLSEYGLVTIDDQSQQVGLTAKGRLCIEEICCLFTLSNIDNSADATLGRAEKQKLDKHNFVPTYDLKRQ